MHLLMYILISYLQGICKVSTRKLGVLAVFFFSCFFLSQRILGSKTYTEQQRAKGSQFDDTRGRLFFLRSTPEEVLKDQKAFTPFALDRFKDQAQPFVLIKIFPTFVLVLFPLSFSSEMGGNASQMLGLTHVRNLVIQNKQSLIILTAFDF